MMTSAVADKDALVTEIVAVPGRVEEEVIEVADLFVRREGKLCRAQGFPPHADRFRRAGYDLATLLAAVEPQ